ncbi:histidine phosphatase family protein [Sneathiella sp. P13V-1]|uniref:histidine phosphatase family protein n=1 Tax=Sneathiella sp. P13V-1 TaxID=2697366 RepID=UPI00187B9AE6|nr:histidine phosphatase family protein [Sneathiella sp. P13V-1]MBE7635827.1 histidine phosphatase family protein [Sneathiella sp. P13V-1]
MIPLLVIRHGKTEWNLQKKLQGRTDIPLSEIGISEMRAASLPERFDGFKWYASPLKRARQTAELLGGEDHEVAQELIEMNFGDWEGFTIRELREKYGATMAENEARGRHMKPNGGESPAEVQERLIPFLKNLQEPSIVVTHKGVIRALKSLAYNWDMTDKAPVAFDWGTAHLFMIDEKGHPHPEQVNIKLESKA